MRQISTRKPTVLRIGVTVAIAITRGAQAAGPAQLLNAAEVLSALDQRIQRLQIELLDERLHDLVVAFDSNVDVLHT
jgi:hypothetical protein